MVRDASRGRGPAVRGPVDINGLPRTGTTALANMLSLDPQFRCLRGWEQTKPCPPPVLADEAERPAAPVPSSEMTKHGPQPS